VDHVITATPFQHHTKMHQILQIIELLHRIFGYMGREDQVTCALVCRAWSEVALDVIWYRVDDFRSFANLLSPVKKRVEESEVSYVRLLLLKVRHHR